VQDPLTLINQGNYNKVPVVIGNVGQEAWLFVYEAFGKLNRAETELLVDAIFRVDPKSIFDLYQLPEEADDYRPWVSYMASDFIIRCSSRNVSNALIRDVPVYRCGLRAMGCATHPHATPGPLGFQCLGCAQVRIQPLLVRDRGLGP
jgi:carboxylesterase type B